jgi:epoxide hydrolase 4
MISTLPITHRTISTNNIRLHVAEMGDPQGELVILLHGFPEFWYGWRAQMPALAEAGFHVLAPDQRGYNLSDKPRGVAARHLGGGHSRHHRRRRAREGVFGWA